MIDNKGTYSVSSWLFEAVHRSYFQLQPVEKIKLYKFRVLQAFNMFVLLCFIVFIVLLGFASLWWHMLPKQTPFCCRAGSILWRHINRRFCIQHNVCCTNSAWQKQQSILLNLQNAKFKFCTSGRLCNANCIMDLILRVSWEKKNPNLYNIFVYHV